MQKNILGIGLSLIAMSFSYADNQVSSPDQRKNSENVITPATNPSIKHGANMFVFGELLYWKATEQGLPLGITGESALVGDDFSMTNSKIKNLDSKWDVGMRLGVGYTLPHDGWDVSLTWLHFNPSSHHVSMAEEGTRVIFPSLTPASDPIADNEGCAQAKGHWSLSLNQLDLDMGREFLVSKWLRLRPHVGLRADWITQRVNAVYINFFADGYTEVDINYKDNWWGMGIETGLDTQWDLGKGFSIFADAAVALLYGNHSLHFTDVNIPPSSNDSPGTTSEPTGVYANLKDSNNNISHPILDLQIGLRWDWLFSDERFHLGLQAGWEDHVYFSQNQFPDFADDFNLGKFFANQSDLSLQGWTFGARFDF